MEEILLDSYGLSTKSIGRKCLLFDELDSTNTYLLENCSSLPHGATVVAKYQTCGKGRQNREWIAEKDSALLFSVLIKSDLPIKEKFKMVFAAACAVKLGIHKIYSVTPAVKWPNDIFIEDKKIAGILCQMSGNDVIAGIGVNVNQETFPDIIKDKASSLNLITGQKFPVLHVLSVLLNQLEKHIFTFEQEGFFFIQTEIMKNFYLKDKMISIESGNEIHTGIAIGIDEEGKLLLKEGNQVKKIISGDAHIC